MISEEKFKALFPNASSSSIKLNTGGTGAIRVGSTPAVQPPVGTPEAPKGTARPRRKAPPSVAKSPLRHGLLPEVSGEKRHLPRVFIRVTSYRRRLIDPDNAVEKYFVDFLRHSGIIYDDTPDLIEIQFAQIKVETAEEDGITKLEVIPEHLWPKCRQA